MLANDGAVIYSVDVDSIYEFRRGKLIKTDVSIEHAVKMSHVVICGVPSKGYKLESSLIQPGTTVVNVASFKNVDEEEILKIPGVKYVPQVGKITVAMLERNLLRLHQNFVESSAPQCSSPGPRARRELA
jgi:methylenetetrahydrofolate dehydrogenase (NAD+)